MAKAKRIFGKLFFSLLLAAELAALADLITAFAGGSLSLPAFVGIFAGCFVLFLLFRHFRLSSVRFFALSIFVVCLLLVLAAAGFLAGYSRTGKYAETDDGKSALYAGRRVLVVAPHEGDELAIAGGVMEEYLKYGSEVYVLFTADRAPAASDGIGIPEDHRIFLGDGKSRTDIADGLGSTLRELQPDVIFGPEYEPEPHSDLRTAALALDEALCDLLQEEASYRPLVLKTYACSMAYEAAPDFYSMNMLSTKNPTGSDLLPGNNILSWSGRVRLPVSAGTLSRSLLGSAVYRQLRQDTAQDAAALAERVISGDRVYWQRDTGSQLLRAQVSATSGDAGCLNDFKLLDSSDVTDSGAPREGVWAPDADDREREITVSFRQPTYLTELCLYDNPSLEDNITGLLVRMDSGREIRFGALDPAGRPTVIPLGTVITQGFSIRLLHTRGSQAGLTEIEAYRSPARFDLDYIKLMDEDANFVYDYYIRSTGRESFQLYTGGAAPQEVNETNYVLSLSNSSCRAVLEDGKISVSCPRGESCDLTVSTADGTLSDTVRISNPGRFQRSTAQSLEKLLCRIWEDTLPRTACYQLLCSLADSK